jgi:ABC-type glycerol-3-phosphate transport system substrate-binding protein
MTKRLIAILALAAALVACSPGASPSVQAPSVSVPTSAPSVESSPSEASDDDGGDDDDDSASPS